MRRPRVSRTFSLVRRTWAAAYFFAVVVFGGLHSHTTDRAETQSAHELHAHPTGATVHAIPAQTSVPHDHTCLACLIRSEHHASQIGIELPQRLVSTPLHVRESRHAGRFAPSIPRGRGPPLA